MAHASRSWSSLPCTNHVAIPTQRAIRSRDKFRWLAWCNPRRGNDSEPYAVEKGGRSSTSDVRICSSASSESVGRFPSGAEAPESFSDPTARLKAALPLFIRTSRLSRDVEPFAKRISRRDVLGYDFDLSAVAVSRRRFGNLMHPRVQFVHNVSHRFCRSSEPVSTIEEVLNAAT